MMRFPRPCEPEGFRETVREAQANIDTALAEGRALTKDDFPDLWKKHKPYLAEAQHSKCGYCERDITDHGGDVEHYRPKAELEGLAASKADRGTEDPRTGNMAKPRRNRALCSQGYPWLAYEWTNYLVSCRSCNEKWKRNLFPVAEEPRPLPPVRGGMETPLLLDPFGEVEPLEHLQYDTSGSVIPRNGSPIGRATIDTCALDRPSLVRARLPLAADVDALIMDFLDASENGERERALDRLREKGSLARPHSGMVRSIVLEVIGLSWSEIEVGE